MEEYAAQEDTDGIHEDLRAQLRSAHGTVGSLDVEHCLDIIEAHDVTLVVTDTGTGKSSLIPKGLYLRNPKSKIVNCQPRRTSTITLAQRVSLLMGEAEVGRVVGYSVRGERAGEIGQTPLMYVTNFTLFLFLLWKKPEEIPFTHIILDEFHERGSEVELMLVLLKLVIQRFPNKFKIILCSATAQVEEWIDFFKNLSVGEYTQANPMFPVHKYYMEDICELVGAKCPRIEVSPYNSVHSLHLHNISGVIKKSLCFLARVLDPHHSILVFLPGRTTVESFAKWIHSELNNELDPIMWYAGVDLSYIQEAIQREPTTKKKVYLATDIAELSLTLPDAVIAIDSGMCKRPLVSEKNPYSVVFPPLELLWEGRLNAQQRCGRVGRVQQGFYFSMLYRDHFCNLGDSDSRITNSVLNSIVLLSLQLANSPTSVFKLCYEQPRVISILHSIDTLQDDGFIISESHKLASQEVIRCIKQKDRDAIASSDAWKKLVSDIQVEKKRQEALMNRTNFTSKSKRPDLSEKGLVNDQGRAARKSMDNLPSNLWDACFQVTLKGFFVSYLHTSIESASTAFYGVMFNIPMLGIIASVVESVKSPFNTPYDIYDRALKIKSCKEVSNLMQTFKGHLNSDIVSCVGAVLSYMDMQRSGYSEEAQEQWCVDHFLSRIRLTETVNVIRQMTEHVSIFFPLPESIDVDELLEQYDDSALLLNFICVGSHLQRAVYVHQKQRSQRYSNQAGKGIFIKMDIEKNFMIPTVCPWHESSVCVPLSLRTSYEKLRAEFATQVDPSVFNLATLIFAFRVVFRLPDVLGKGSKSEDPKGERDDGHRSAQKAGVSKHFYNYFIFQVIFMGVQQTFACDTLTGQQIIQLRRMMCARLRAMHIFLEEQNDMAEDLGIMDMGNKKAPIVKGQDDFGIPHSFLESPEGISALLQQGLTKLLNRFEHVRGNRVVPPKEGGEQGSDDDKKGVFCSVIGGPPVLDPPVKESLLVHSCNGIFPVEMGN
ncbi:unnamed protein product [Phytomonas sp. Hart1]|nr:unnamed protein product [Phytomonas sp. Hart1]|eukprot:CCW69430.1 unnamed protein product [Phytomonas sp. isolate Hart1]